jgi:hypothetical protein
VCIYLLKLVKGKFFVSCTCCTYFLYTKSFKKNNYPSTSLLVVTAYYTNIGWTLPTAHDACCFRDDDRDKSAAYSLTTFTRPSKEHNVYLFKGSSIFQLQPSHFRWKYSRRQQVPPKVKRYRWSSPYDRPRRPRGVEIRSTLSLTSALDGVGGHRHAPAALSPGNTRYQPCRRLGGPQGRSGRMREISPPNVILTLDRPARSESLYGSSKSTVNLLSQFEPTNVRNFIKITILQYTRCYTFRPTIRKHKIVQNNWLKFSACSRAAVNYSMCNVLYCT